MKLTKNQKHFLKTIKDKKIRKYQKQQFKLQNEFENRQIIKQFPFSIVDISFKEEFEKVNCKGFTWYEHNAKEVEEKFNKLANNYKSQIEIAKDRLNHTSLDSKIKVDELGNWYFKGFEKVSELPKEKIQFDFSSANLSDLQIEKVVEWMNTWEQLKDTAIPIRFKEDFTIKKQ